METLRTMIKTVYTKSFTYCLILQWLKCYLDDSYDYLLILGTFLLFGGMITQNLAFSEKGTRNLQLTILQFSEFSLPQGDSLEKRSWYQRQILTDHVPQHSKPAWPPHKIWKSVFVFFFDSGAQNDNFEISQPRNIVKHFKFCIFRCNRLKFLCLMFESIIITESVTTQTGNCWAWGTGTKDRNIPPLMVENTSITTYLSQGTDNAPGSPSRPLQEVFQLKQTLNFCSTSSIHNVESRYRDVYAEVPKSTLEIHVHLIFASPAKHVSWNRLRWLILDCWGHNLQMFEVYLYVVWL